MKYNELSVDECQVSRVDTSVAVVVLQLGPWLAVEIPDLISKGLVRHKD